MKTFEQETAERVERNGQDDALRNAAATFVRASIARQYSYNFTWLGRPIIQYPQDIVAMQELIWSVQPELIVETGIAHGGSLILSASMLELNAVCGGSADARVVGIDIDIRPHNREAIEAHPMSKRITLFQGSSIDPQIIGQVHALASGRRRILVCLDSHHTHDHVFAELMAYAPLTTVGSYCVVFDTIVEDLPDGMYPDRPWGPGDNPKTAAAEYLRSDDRFEVDANMEAKLLITVAPGGYLRRVR